MHGTMWPTTRLSTDSSHGRSLCHAGILRQNVTKNHAAVAAAAAVRRIRIRIAAKEEKWVMGREILD